MDPDIYLEAKRLTAQTEPNGPSLCQYLDWRVLVADHQAILDDLERRIPRVSKTTKEPRHPTDHHRPIHMYFQAHRKVHPS